MIIDRGQQNLTIDGQYYSHSHLLEFLQSGVWKDSDEKAQLWDFLCEWFDDSPLLKIHTSGSTGSPKYINVRKDQMINSACITCNYLKLKSGDSALLCMSLQYIAGKMVVIRALVSELNLIYRQPSGHPMKDVNIVLNFAAMVPLQVYNSMQNDKEKERICKIKNLIIGGGPIDENLLNLLQIHPENVYSTYGMTETLSHIALRRLNGEESSLLYHPFKSVKLTLSDEGTLVINAPLVCEKELVTNDIARLYDDGSFEILGRKDNVVNSGGIKIQIEEIENKIKPLFKGPYALTSIKDNRLGETLVLLIEKGCLENNATSNDISLLKSSLMSLINDKYRCPKYILFVSKIPMTGNGKINRAECKALAKSNFKKDVICC